MWITPEVNKRLNMNNKHAVIAMSGGVDSSVSAALLQEQGYHVSGISLQLYDPVQREPDCKIKTCCSLVTKNRGHFPGDEAMFKLIYLALKNIAKKVDYADQ